MKIRDILIAVGAVVFSVLFYQQGQGFNYALFSVLLIGSLAIVQPKATKSRSWWWCVAAVVFTAVCMVWYGNSLCFYSQVFAWMLLSAFTYRPKNSAVLNFAQGYFSLVLSVPNSVQGWYRQALRKSTKGKFNFNHWHINVLILGVVLLFIILYANASAAFSNVLQQIDLSFISFGWVVTTFLGAIVCTILIRHRRIKTIDFFEKKWAAPLVALLYPPSPEFTEKQAVERKAGGVLLLSLNVVLLVVNLSDIVFLSSGIAQNARINFSDLVHQGIGALIASIVFAVAILLFFFRGQLNFDGKAKPLYFLALLWIVQNLVLVSTSGIKNTLYIDIVDGLTYKRIGVYYYLLLCVIGLVFTAYKLHTKKPNWYLMRVNFTVFFGILVLSSAVNWDAVITNFNIQQAQAKGKAPDIEFMTKLSDNNLIQLVDWVREVNQNPSSVNKLSQSEVAYLCKIISVKAFWFAEDFKQKDWQSWNYQSQKIYDYLKNVDLSMHYKPNETYRYLPHNY